MANTILTPGEENVKQTSTIQSIPYLEKDKYLSEFQTTDEKAVVRENLNVYSKDSVYNKTESDTLLDRTIKEAFDKYLNMEDPHGILPTVEEMLEGVVRNDGSTPFLAPQQGVDPVQDYHLATKRFVTRLLKEHTDTEDPHRILPEVEDMLEQYISQYQFLLIVYCQALPVVKYNCKKSLRYYILCLYKLLLLSFDNMKGLCMIIHIKSKEKNDKQ